MESRNFQLDTEWNMIHYSEMPNGFGILIVGDDRHFVDDKKSFWTQNEGKQLLLRELKKNGYTVYYSNLYGKNWGTIKAVELAKRLYEKIKRTEILNRKIHVIAEGMGALVAIQLMSELQEDIRSVVLLNPIFSLKDHIDKEKEHKFFYKRLIREVAHAYDWDIKEVEGNVGLLNENLDEITHLPIKIIHVLSGNRAYKQSEYSKTLMKKWTKTNHSIQAIYILPEKKQQLGRLITNFLQKYESEL